MHALRILQFIDFHTFLSSPCFVHIDLLVRVSDRSCLIDWLALVVSPFFSISSANLITLYSTTGFDCLNDAFECVVGPILFPRGTG